MENSSHIPQRDEEFQSLKNKFTSNSKSEDLKKFTPTAFVKEKIPLASGDNLPIPKWDEATEANLKDEKSSEVEDATKMPSVKELAMKFKSSSTPGQSKILPPVKKISTSKPPSRQLSSPTGEVQQNGSVKHIPNNGANEGTHKQTSTNADNVDEHQQPTHLKRTVGQPKKPSIDELHVSHVPTPVTRTTTQSNKEVFKEQVEQIKDSEDSSQEPKLQEVDSGAQQTAAVGATIPSIQSVSIKIQPNDPEEEIQEETTAEQILTSTERIHQKPPMTLKIPAPGDVQESDNEMVFSPPLPKTPPPNKVPFIPPMPKTPPPHKSPFFSDIMDPSLSISPLSEGGNGEEIVLRISPGEMDGGLPSFGDRENLLPQQHSDVKWDAFAEINNNTKKSIETKLIFSAAATEFYDKTSPLEIQKTFNSNETEENQQSSNLAEELQDSVANVTEEILNTKDAEIMPTSSNEQFTSESEDKVDFTLMKPDETSVENTAISAYADEIPTASKYNRQTSEIGTSSSAPQTKVAYSRMNSLPQNNVDPERRKTAMEVLATPPIFRPKEEEDLIKLRKQIVRASRSRTPNSPALK